MSAIEIAEKIIKSFEGCKLTAYICPTGHLTIGWGHTGRDVFAGMTITQEQADDLLAKDIQYFYDRVMADITVELNDNRIAALIDFVFNLGDSRLRSSTLLKKINASDFDGAGLEFVRWDKGTIDGELVEVDGLKRRRIADTDLWCLAA
jgi:lysozyme